MNETPNGFECSFYALMFARRAVANRQRKYVFPATTFCFFERGDVFTSRETNDRGTIFRQSNNNGDTAARINIRVYIYI